MPDNIKSKFDFSNVDTRNIDPDRLDFGTSQADCSLIASVFERGAHATPSEGAVFSTLTRNVQNNKNFAGAAADSLETYLQAPAQAAKNASTEAQSFASDIDGATQQTDQNMQSFNIGSQQHTTYSDDFGQKLLESARDCIPCDLRLMSFLEIHPNLDLLDVLDGFLSAQLSMLSDLTGLLNDVSIYGDFCAFIDSLSFMCVPDLQRIIATLMALFTLKIPELDGLIGMLQALVVPIFAPLLMSLTALLDQFTLLVTSPLDCVVDALNAQLEKLTIEGNRFTVSVDTPTNPFDQLSGGLKQLNTQIQDAVKAIEAKMSFYTSQIKAMLGEMGGGDGAYLRSKLEVLQIIRMVSFVSAIISAISKGHAACSDNGKTPETSEIDNFFENFLNPNSPFRVWFDENGQLHLDEKVDDMDEVLDPSYSDTPLIDNGNVFKFEGEDALDPTVANQIDSINSDLAKPVNIVIPCKLETSVGEVDQVNQWISELNQ